VAGERGMRVVELLLLRSCYFCSSARERASERAGHVGDGTSRSSSPNDQSRERGSHHIECSSSEQIDDLRA